MILMPAESFSICRQSSSTDRSLSSPSGITRFPFYPHRYKPRKSGCYVSPLATSVKPRRMQICRKWLNACVPCVTLPRSVGIDVPGK